MSGGQLLQFGGQLLYFQPALTPSLPGHGRLTVYAVSLRQPGVLTGHGKLAASTIPKRAVAAALHGYGGLAVTAKAIKFSFTAAASGHGVVTAIATVVGVYAGNATGNGALTATAAAKSAASAALPGHGVAAAAVFAKFSDTAALPGHGVLAATAKATEFVLSAALPGHGALSATAAAAASAAPHSHGVLSATTKAKIPVAAAPHGHGVLSATAVKVLAVAFDGVGAGDVSSPFSWLHPAGAVGADIFVSICDDTSATVSTITYGGTTMTLVTSIGIDGSASNGTLWLYRLAGGGTGVQETVAVTFSASPAAACNSVSYANVVSIGTAATVDGSGTPLSQSGTCSTGGMILQTFGNTGATALSAYADGTGFTSRYSGASSTGFGRILIGDTTATSATFTATGGGSGKWAGIIVALNN